MWQGRAAMKRIARRAALFLLLATIVNVAVAWGCVIWPPRPPKQGWPVEEQGFTRHGDGFHEWSVRVYRGPRWTKVWSGWATGSSIWPGPDGPKTSAEVLPRWADYARPTGDYPLNVVVE